MLDPKADRVRWQRLPNIKTGPMQTGDPRGIYRSDNHGWFFGWSNNRGALHCMLGGAGR